MLNKIYKDRENNNYKFIVIGKPKKTIPKSWKKIKHICIDQLSSSYNTGYFTIYTNPSCKANEYMYSTYRDGCFYEICGKIMLI